ncbi:FUSC family protein [Bradyrhizobium japonicum]|uniref:FUSC family protein n=1 Tax=Bradyrhizobium japonicum TaxID=375 RepID=UPI00209F31B6|nr:FUSC family protein [Bradyrhizobium japonicum]MCP1766358.1 hypothetical protein [Bradyrhizobium japonicum]MCP1788496.1 hypothetical protein [Bradyrhizobium japonicum]MCP1810371.1 hypothetical protein [Bradyrhizobium japonicum]MCP1819305.1 hypothetical protein [Bradyrhizobium japonicum]MCP1869185.1 hypothetical protein [Bradyrhizobium japonicum]
MPRDDLRELRERVEYCRNEIPRLASALKAYSDQHFQLREAMHPPHRAVEARLAAQIPVHCREHAGQIINGLRACLDGLACRLAERNGQTTDQVYFPVSKDLKSFGSDGRKKIKKLHQDDQDKIAALSPFRGGDDLLFALHEVDKKRKHNILAASAGMNAGQGLSNGYADFTLGMPGKQLTTDWQPIMLMGPGTHGRFNFSFDIVFSEPQEIAGRRVVDVLGQFSGRVSDIIGLFDSP